MKSESENLKYSIDKTVKVDGFDLPPGKYIGRRVRIGTPRMGKTIWQAWEYKIDYGDWSDLHCDKQVSSGEIKVIG